MDEKIVAIIHLLKPALDISLAQGSGSTDEVVIEKAFDLYKRISSKIWQEDEEA